MAAERETEERLQTGDEDRDGEFDVASEEVHGVQEAENVQRESPTEKTVPEFCLRFAEIAPQLVSRETRKEVEKISEVVFDSDFDAEEGRRHVKEVYDYTRLLKDSRNEALAGEGLARETVQNGKCFPVPKVVSYRKDVLAVLRSQIKMSSPQDVLCSSQDVPKHAGHSVDSLHRRDTKRKVLERVTGSAGRDVWWST